MTLRRAWDLIAMVSEFADPLYVLSALTENPKRGLFFLIRFSKG